jgi:outer membrane protein insertion porin family
MVLLTLPAASYLPAQQAPDAEPAEPSPAITSPLDGRVVSVVRIEGLVAIDEAYVRNQMRTQQGQPYSQDQLQRDIGRLLRTGRFIDVHPETQVVDEQVQITLRLTEKPSVAAVEFVGNKKFKPKDLLEALAFAAGDPLDLYDVSRGREAIERLYREKGYAYVEVTFDEQLMRDEQRVVYTVVENQRVRVRKVRFEGNVTYSARELETQVETKPFLPIFRAGDFDPDRAERDAAKVQQYYRERGFLDARVSYVTEFEDVARERLALIFRVSEGVRYRIREIIIRGNEVFTTEQISEKLTLQVDDFLMDGRVKADVKTIETDYGAQGYIYAQAVPTWVFAEEPEQVVLTLTIREGEQFRVGWIEVNGNTHTQEKCVRRELRFHPEELFDTTKTAKAERRLKESGLFTEATVEAIEPSSGEANVRDALGTVQENPRTNQFIAGVGASSDSGLVGNIVLENTNFDLFDTPRDLNEFIRGRSFRGAGQTFRIQLEPGTELNRFRIDFREPYLLDMPIGFGTSLYLFERGRDGYNEQRAGW